MRWVGGSTSPSRAISEKSVTRWSRTKGARATEAGADGVGALPVGAGLSSGWRIAAPSRTIIPELKRRWTGTDAVELSDRSTPNELDLVRSMASRYDAVLAGVFVRASSGSGRLDLAPGSVRLLEQLARDTTRRGQPMAAVVFGNPYVSASMPDVPAMLLTYDFSDLAEESAVKALSGEIPIVGRLPIAIPGLFEVGFGPGR
ncbi:MAG: hypothetical protein R2712_15720 [Vicinamibacterales bacterium]